jgi:hypothetical protein
LAAKNQGVSDCGGDQPGLETTGKTFRFNSNFTLTAGFACHKGVMGEPFPCWRSFETDTGF